MRKNVLANPQSITSALVPSPGSSPLMQPVDYQGETYLASQYFHQQYVANSSVKGKYQRYDHFLRLLRSIETYEDHKSLGNIIEIEFARIKAEPTPILVKFTPLFRAAGYHPLTLINATAQAALSHHLDDKLSKQMSVAINTHAAQQATRRGGSLEIEQRATNKLAACLEAGQLLGVPLHLAQQEAVKMVEAATGVNFRPLLKAAPSQDHIPEDEVMLEPTELAKRLGQSSGRVINLLLEEIGWQCRQAGAWEPTSMGASFAARHAWTSDHGTKTGVNYKWRLSAVQQALRNAGLLS